MPQARIQLKTFLLWRDYANQGLIVSVHESQQNKIITNSVSYKCWFQELLGHF